MFRFFVQYGNSFDGLLWDLEWYNSNMYYVYVFFHMYRPFAALASAPCTARNPTLRQCYMRLQAFLHFILLKTMHERTLLMFWTFVCLYERVQTIGHPKMLRILVVLGFIALCSAKTPISHCCSADDRHIVQKQWQNLFDYMSHSSKLKLHFGELLILKYALRSSLSAKFLTSFVFNLHHVAFIRVLTDICDALYTMKVNLKCATKVPFSKIFQ